MKPKLLLIILLHLLILGCSKSNNKSQPIVNFYEKSFSIENADAFDYYNLQMQFAGKYNLEYNLLPNGSKVNYKYSELGIEANFLELNKDSVVIKYQDSLGNNYEFAKLKTVNKNISENTEMTWWENFKAVLKSQTFIAIILALIAGFVALHQVKSNVISAARIKWIEEFKSNVAMFSVNVNMCVFNHISYINESKEDDQKFMDDYYNRYLDAHHTLLRLNSLIKLNLNLTEQLHKNIDSTMDNILIQINNVNIDNVNYDNFDKLVGDYSDKLIDYTNKALKLEWEKSKKMFYVKWFGKKIVTN